MDKKYILALDQGTTSSRAILFDKSGTAVSAGQYEFPQVFPRPGWVEHDPEEIFRSQMKAAHTAMEKAGAGAGSIAAIGIANQRETTIVWDRETGLPIYNAIVWQCRRTAHICDELIREGAAAAIADKTGLIVDAYFSGTKIKWILDHVPGAGSLAASGRLAFGTVETWLIWRLTAGKVHATDHTNASRTMLLDLDKLCWDEGLTGRLGVPGSMLPEIKPSSHVYGEVAEGVPGAGALAGIPIAGAAGDQHAALFGSACFTPGQAKNTYGTGCFLLMNTGAERARSKARLLSTVAWSVGDTVEYALEGSLFNAGSAIQWLRDDLGIISTASECDELAESVGDNGGVYFVPAFTGLGAPYWDMYARGAIVGLTRGATRAHIARATLESIAYGVGDLVSAMVADTGLTLPELRVDGGASVSDFLMQFQADLLGTPINRPRNTETTALGAAYLAGLATGFWRDKEELRSIWSSERVFLPQMARAERDGLVRNWKRAVEKSLGWDEESE
ncbi:MAG: glycerol kinase GlpK [Oscillospiraceae bacterium]|jgi:glycerol kinase|nr:glycerol kinase GlpK [Oscillospiraceae bacterium]